MENLTLAQDAQSEIEQLIAQNVNPYDLFNVVSTLNAMPCDHEYVRPWDEAKSNSFYALYRPFEDGSALIFTCDMRLADDDNPEGTHSLDWFAESTKDSAAKLLQVLRLAYDRNAITEEFDMILFAAINAMGDMAEQMPVFIGEKMREAGELINQQIEIAKKKAVSRAKGENIVEFPGPDSIH